MKLIEILVEGLRKDASNKLIASKDNKSTDLLQYNPGDKNKGGHLLNYSFTYSTDRSVDGEAIKSLADDIKNGTIQYTTEFIDIIKKDVRSLATNNFAGKQVDQIGYLGSSKGFSKIVAQWVQSEMGTDIPIVPVSKIAYPSWESLLHKDKFDKIEDEKFKQSVQRVAQDMYNKTRGTSNVGHMKTTNLSPKLKSYFKVDSKYDTSEVSGKNIILVDDNIQTGTDGSNMLRHLEKAPGTVVLFYAPILLNTSSKKTVAQSGESSKAPLNIGNIGNGPKPVVIKIKTGYGILSNPKYNVNLNKLVSKGQLGAVSLYDKRLAYPIISKATQIKFKIYGDIKTVDIERLLEK